MQILAEALFSLNTTFTTGLVQQYSNKRIAEGAANGTLNREISTLRHAFYLGLKSTPPKVRQVPVMKLHAEANPRQGFLADADYNRLAAECNKVGLWLRALFTTACSFAFRRGELVALKVEQVDLIDKTIRLYDTKNGSGRVVALTEQVATLLTACCIDKKPDDFVFTRNGKRIGDFRKTWANVCAAAGVGWFLCPICKETIDVSAEGPYRHRGKKWRRCDLRFKGLLVHDLRRTGVRDLRRLGIPESVCMKISGHKTRSTFERYNIRGRDRPDHRGFKAGGMAKGQREEFWEWSCFGHSSEKQHRKRRSIPPERQCCDVA